MRRSIYILLALACLMPFAASAQCKVATVNVQELFESHPASQAARQQLRDLSGKLHGEYEAMQADFDKKYAAYQQISSDNATPQAIKERRVRELQEGDLAIGSFLDESQRLLNKRKAELEAPIYQDINDAIRAIGDEQNLTYVLDVSKTPVAYAGQGAIDITEAVKQRLAATR